MPVLGSVLGAYVQSRSVENPQKPLTDATLIEALGGQKTFSGVTVSPEKSLNLSAVYRATALLAGSVAGLPLNAYRYKSFESIESPILNTPHPDLTDYEFWELAMVHLLLWGNFYAQIIRAGGTSTIAELHPIHPSKVRVKREKPSDANPSGKIFEVSGGQETFTSYDMFHIPGMGYDGKEGLSVIGCARQSLGVALAAEEYAGRLFGSGSMQSGILSYDGKLKDEDRSRLKSQWNERHQGLERAHEVAIFDKSLKWESISIPPEDAQFLQSREFQVTECARWFGIAPHMLFDVNKTTSWGSGIEQQGIGYVVYSLRFWTRRIERRVTRHLLPRNQYSKFLLEGLLRGDTKTRYDAYQKGRMGGWLSANEIREKEDMEPIEGGDEYLSPLNMSPVGEQEPEEEPEEKPEGSEE